MGLASVPISSVPPAATVRFPPTSVKVLELTRLARKVPLIVVVLAVALEMSSVTVVPPAITTGLAAVGTTQESQVDVSDQLLEAMLVIVAPGAKEPPPPAIVLPM